MLIYLIRHGETASNVARILQTPDIPLSATGIRQAELVARRLAAVHSTLVRVLSRRLYGLAVWAASTRCC